MEDMLKMILSEIKDLKTEMNQRFEEQDKKIDSRFAEQEKKLDEKLDIRFAEQEKKFDKKLENLSKDIAMELRGIVSSIEKKQKEQFSELSEKIDDINEAISLQNRFNVHRQEKCSKRFEKLEKEQKIIKQKLNLKNAMGQ